MEQLVILDYNDQSVHIYNVDSEANSHVSTYVQDHIATHKLFETVFGI